jgi:hypothetical protein
MSRFQKACCESVNKVLLAIMAGLAFASCSKPTESPQPECGIERWHVKNLLDPEAMAIRWSPLSSSIAQQDSFARITINENTPRLDFEKQATSIECTIVQFVKEDDGDIHLVLQDAALDSMIAEIPSTDCAEVAGSPHASDFKAAYEWVREHLGNPSTSFKTANANVTITGVLFQDFDHGQKGHAKNYREIHPVTKIE